MASATLTYISKAFHGKPKELERVMLDMQAIGAVPIYRRGDRWIFELFKEEVDKKQNGASCHTVEGAATV